MLPPTTTIGFVHLTVADRDAAMEFYGGILGFVPADGAGSGTQALSATGRPSYHFLLTTDPQARSRPRSAGLYHTAILYPTRAELGGAFRRLLELGWPIHGASDHGVSEAIYLSDPEGNGIEIYADRPRERWPKSGEGLVMPTKPLDIDHLLAEAAGEWHGLAPRTRIGHIHLRVTDLQRAEAFYNGILGFDVMVRTYQGALFFAAGGYHHHIGVNIWAGHDIARASPESRGLRSFSIRFPDRPALAAAISRVQEAGLPVRAVDHGVCLAAYVSDPDGITVALAADVPGETGWKETPVDLDSLI